MDEGDADPRPPPIGSYSPYKVKSKWPLSLAWVCKGQIRSQIKTRERFMKMPHSLHRRMRKGNAENKMKKKQKMKYSRTRQLLQSS